MKKLYKNLKMLTAATLLSATGAYAQCIGGTNYLSASLNGTTTANQYISGCTYAGERNALNVTFLGGVYNFYSTAPYLSVYDAITNVNVAHGVPPLTNVSFPATGQYYLQPSMAAPPTCGNQSTCFSTEWSCQIPCSGVPVTGTTVATPSLACPNIGSAILLNGATTTGGVTFQWYSSTTGLAGTWGAVANATTASYQTPTPVSAMYYRAVITCPNSSSSATTSAAQVLVSGTTTNSVPYYENYEGIGLNNQLPNCSWLKTGTGAQTYTAPAVNNRVARSGNRFASFNSPGGVAGTNSFYSNGIQLEPGVTYSASVWYTTESYGYTNFKLTMSLGQTQTQTGLVTLAGGGAVASPVYKEMANTFTVATSGLYYVNLKADHDNTYGAYYLSWDDLSITAPCSLNSPTVSLQSSTTTICEGDAVTLNASGADTYTWSTGSNANLISESPVVNTLYTVTGANALTGCEVTLSEMIIVNKAPTLFVFADKMMVCSGSPVNLSAVGNAVSYIWNAGNGANITVMPTAALTSYTAVGTSNDGCKAEKAITIGTYSNPAVFATATKAEICSDEAAVLTASGAVSYQWVSDASSSLFVGTTINVPLTTTANFTVTGTDSHGCVGKSTISQVVSPCTGISENAKAAGLNFYPNPTSGIVTIEVNSTSEKTVQVLDLTGRVVAVQTSNDQKINSDLTNLSAGIYYIKIQTAEFTEILKVVKQ